MSAFGAGVVGIEVAGVDGCGGVWVACVVAEVGLGWLQVEFWACVSFTGDRRGCW